MLSKRAQPLVVVIGASAGGVDALDALLPHLAGAMAVIVVVHLPEGKPSLLVEIFSPRCKLAVKEVEDKEPLVPRSIYFAPPDYHVLIEKSLHLALSVDERVHHSRPSIDVLFQSAADALGAAVSGVLLTGANADGAAGLAAIAHAGGTTIVQDPATAASPEMPSA
ncbi:MAG: chemotaxis protein CheB, partial [Betaproteobacteria bacterium]